MKNSSCIIRNYHPNDFNLLSQLHLSTEQHEASEPYLTSNPLAEALNRPNYVPKKDLFLAEMEDEIVGFCSLTPELKIGRVLLYFLVHPEQRRTGIAARLFEHAVKRAKEYRVKVAQVEIPETNLAAKGLLSSLHFNPIRIFKELALELSNMKNPNVDSALIRRNLTNGNENILTDIQNRSFEGTWGFNPNTNEEIIYDLNRSDRSPEDVILIYDGNDIIGYCWTKIQPEENPEQMTRRGRIHMMGVDPDCRGKGLGKAVLLAGLSHLKDKGIKSVELTVDSENKVACGL